MSGLHIKLGPEDLYAMPVGIRDEFSENLCIGLPPPQPPQPPPKHAFLRSSSFSE